MVNPYELSSRQNQKKQVSLTSSNALKKFEKIQAKHTGKSSKSKSKKSFSPNSSSNENSIISNDNDDDDDSIFKNLNKNKFVKKKPLEEKKSDSDKSELSDTDLEISIADQSSTPFRKSSIQRPSSQIRSEASSVTEFQSSNLPKRSPSRVKFLKQDSITDQDESQIEDLIGNNLVLSIDDLEPADTKFFKKSKSKSSINSGRRTASAASIIEEDEISTASISTQSHLMNPNLILDIHEMDKSESSISKSSRKTAKSSKKKSKDKKKKRSKASNSFIETDTEYKTADSSIMTEIGEKKNKSDSEWDVLSQSYRHSKHKDKSYYEDFETDQDFTTVSRTEKSKRKHLSFVENKKVNMEVQVDPNDLLKNSDLIRSVNAYNPSSLLLASVTYLNEGSNLKDLNQLTGFNLINQTFNDLIRMNVNFMKNFLSTQKSLYEQQIASIQPK